MNHLPFLPVVSLPPPPCEYVPPLLYDAVLPLAREASAVLGSAEPDTANTTQYSYYFTAHEHKAVGTL